MTAGAPNALGGISRDLSFWAKSAFVDSAVLHAAVRLGIFDHLPREGLPPISGEELADRVGAPARGVRVLTDALVGGRVLVRDGRDGLAVRQLLAAALHDPTFLHRLAEAADWWDASASFGEALAAGSGWTGPDVVGRYAELMAAPPPSGDEAEDLYDRAARHYLRTQALVAAAEAGVLAALAEGPVAADDLAARQGLGPRGLEVLLRTLASMGLCAGGGDRPHAFVPEVATALRGRALQAYVLSLQVTDAQWQALGGLHATVATGRRSGLYLQDPERGGRFYSLLARYNIAIFPTYLRVAERVAAALAAGSPGSGTTAADGSEGGRTVLDVGAGSGVWGVAFARAEGRTRVTYLDQPQVLVQTRRTVERLGLSEHATFLPADLLTAEYGTGTYDAIVLGLIVHTQRPQDLPGLFARLAAALRPGGCMVVAGPVLNAGRDGPLDSLLFAVKEFVTTEGDVLSEPEYAHLLSGAGLVRHRVYALPGIDVILAGRDELELPRELPEGGRGGRGATAGVPG